MPADLDLLTRFHAAITGETVTLPTAAGPLSVPKREFAEAVEEIAAARAQAEDAGYALAVTGELIDYVNQLREAGQQPGLQVLEAILGQEQGGEYDPGLVELVTGALQSVGVANANGQTSEALLEMIAAYTAQQGQGAHAAAAEPQVIQQAPAAPVMRPPSRGAQLQPTGPENRAAPIHPNGGLPVRSEPRPFEPVSAEDLFGLKRSGSGRYDSGELAGE